MNFVDFTAAELEGAKAFDASQFMANYLRETALAALPKTVEELSQNERFAIAFYAGVKMQSQMLSDGRMNWTTEPMSIVKDGDKFIVAVYGDAKRAFPANT